MPTKSDSSNLSGDSRFAELGNPAGRVWAIGAIHGQAGQLMALHDRLFGYIRPGDRVVYMGNYRGHGPESCETLDEVLTFRRGILAQPGMLPGDFVYLRGGQEEMWEKLQQLQFAPNPADVLLWMLDNGVTPMLEDYGLRPQDGLKAAREGVMALTRWTSAVRNAIRRHPGHDIFQCQLKRAAFTATDSIAPLLFVHAGIDPHRSLQDQGDALWWGGRHDFHTIENPCAPFRMVVRGFDPVHAGLRIANSTATIDGGCGFGGALIAAAFLPDGQIEGVLEA